MEVVIKIVYLLLKLSGGCDRFVQEEKKAKSNADSSSFSFTYPPPKNVMLLIKYRAVK